FGVTYEAGGAVRTVPARRLLAATGSRDELPDTPGLAERWGSDVLHCPYCHGWEVRDRRIGVLATGPMAAHQALLFSRLSGHVTVIRHGGPEFDDAQSEQCAALGIPVVEGPVSAVESGPDGLTGVVLSDGTVVELDAVVVAPVARARADLLAPLGLRPSDVPAGETVVGTAVDVGPGGRTGIPGVYAAGNITDPMAQLIRCAADGLAAGAMINADLAAADAEDAVYEYRYGQSAWDARYRARDGHAHGDANRCGPDDPARHGDRLRSGGPNSVVVDETADLQPGSAFDAGAGEGGDALW